MKIITTLLLAGALAGCHNSQSLPLSLGYTAVRPTSQMEVGHLYFSGKGKEPRFKTADGTVYNELCYDDFDQFNALKALQDHVVITDNEVTKFTATSNGELGSGISLPLFFGVKAGGSNDSSYVVTGIKRHELSPQGMQVVTDTIGDNCKSEIIKLQRLKRDVIILMAAQKADSIVDSTEFKANATVTVANVPGIDPLVGKVGNKRVVEYKMVFLSGLLSER